MWNVLKGAVAEFQLALNEEGDDEDEADDKVVVDNSRVDQSSDELKPVITSTDSPLSLLDLGAKSFTQFVSQDNYQVDPDQKCIVEETENIIEESKRSDQFQHKQQTVDLNEEFEKVKTRLELATLAKTALESELIELKRENHTLKQSLESISTLPTDSTSQDNCSNMVWKRAFQDAAALLKENTKVMSMQKELRESSEQLKEELVKHQKEIESLLKEIEDGQRDMNSMREKVDQAELTIRMRQQSYESLLEERRRTEKEYFNRNAELKKTNDILNEKLAEAERELKERIHEGGSKNDLKKAIKEIEELQSCKGILTASLEKMIAEKIAWEESSELIKESGLKSVILTCLMKLKDCGYELRDPVAHKVIVGCAIENLISKDPEASSLLESLCESKDLDALRYVARRFKEATTVKNC